MSDFEEELRRTLARNADLAEQREQNEREMVAWEERRAEEAAAARSKAAADRRERHAELARHLEDAARAVKASDPDRFIVRTGWTESGEEFVAKLSTRTLSPKRSLFVEIDRDDDHVLVRWTSDVGTAIEMWRLLEVERSLISQVLLQLTDEALWRDATRPPPFPGQIDP